MTLPQSVSYQGRSRMKARSGGGKARGGGGGARRELGWVKVLEGS